MANLTAAEITKLNKMNRVAKDLSLGTAFGALQSAIVSSGCVTVSALQASASAVVITDANATNGEIIQYLRSTAPMTEKIKVVRSTGGVRTISGSTAANCILAGDVILYLLW